MTLAFVAIHGVIGRAPSKHGGAASSRRIQQAAWMYPFPLVKLVVSRVFFKSLAASNGK